MISIVALTLIKLINLINLFVMLCTFDVVSFCSNKLVFETYRQQSNCKINTASLKSKIYSNYYLL